MLKKCFFSILFIRAIRVRYSFGWSHLEPRSNQHLQQLLASEETIAISRVGALERCHSLKVLQQYRLRKHGRFNAFVAQLAQETSVSSVDSIADDAQVVYRVIEWVTIDMVNRLFD